MTDGDRWMKIATFNINGIRSRLDALLAWLEREAPDVVCLQELKATDAQFPISAIQAAGYGAVWHGQASWNGVAILARDAEPVLSRRGLPGNEDDTHSRYIEAAVHGILIGCLYLPNGNPQPGPKFDYKLAWMERFNAHAKTLFESGHPVILAGDYNVVPTDEDIYNTRSWLKDALLQPESRAAYASCSRRAGRMRCAKSIPMSASIPSGIISASTGRRTRGCASITSCSARILRPGFRMRASIHGCAASRTRATMRPRGSY